MLQYKRRIQYFPIWKMLCRKEKLHAYYFRKRSKDDLTKGQPKVAKLQVGLGIQLGNQVDFCLHYLEVNQM